MDEGGAYKNKKPPGCQPGGLLQLVIGSA